MKTFYCPLCKNASFIESIANVHEGFKVETYCEPCDALTEVTCYDRSHDVDLPIRFEGSD